MKITEINLRTQVCYIIEEAMEITDIYFKNKYVIISEVMQITEIYFFKKQVCYIIEEKLWK